MSIYQKRWSSVGSGASPSSSITRNTPTATNVLSSGVEPSTVGTSWNSVRWNKPSTSYRASLASRFENNPTSNSSYTPQRSSRFLSSAAKNAADVASIGPSVSARASRFDTTSMANKEKYRSEARELINKWSSRERNSNISNTYRSPAPRSTFRSTDSLTTTTASTPTYSNTAYRTSTSLTPTRPTITPSATASRYSTERASLLSPSPTPILHTTPKAERPWRQRMAESSRIRSTLGDDVSEAYTARRARHASSRRSSLSQDELSSYETTRVPSYSALVQQPTSYRSRQSSVESSVFSPSTRFTNASTYVPYSYRNRSDDPPTTRSSILDRSTSRSKSPTRDSLPSRTPSQAPKNSSIRESSKERDAEKQKKKSAKERTARRNSRQNSQQDSSSDEEINRLMRSRSGSQVRRKPKKKSQMETEKLIVVEQKDTLMNRSMQSSLYETGAEDSALIQSLTSQINESLTALAVAAESEGFQSCAASPLAPSISRSSSKNGVVKNQIIKSPSLIEVLGLPRSDSKTSLNKLNDQIDMDEETHDEQLTNDIDDFEVAFPFLLFSFLTLVFLSLRYPLGFRFNKFLNLSQVSESSRIDDESQYSAVAHFKPNKVKRLAPVPGLWKSGAENEEFISRNKRFAKSVSPSVENCMRLENQHGEYEKIIALKRLEKASKSIKVPEKKKPVVLKTKVDPKPDPVKSPEKKAVTAPKVAENPKEAVKPATPATPTKTTPLKSKEIAPTPGKPVTVPQTPTPAISKTPVTATKVPEKAKESPQTAVKPKENVAPVSVEPDAKAVETPKTIQVKPVSEKVSKTAANVEPEKVKSPTVAENNSKVAVENPSVKPVPVVEKPKEIPKETPKEAAKEMPKPGIEKKKIVSYYLPNNQLNHCFQLLKKKKIIPIEDEKPDEVPPKPKVLSEQKTEISKVFSKKSWGSQKTDKVMKMKNNMKGISIRCKSSGNVTTDLLENYRRKPQAERATVLVDTPVLDVNYSTVKISLREKRKKVEKPVEVVTAPPPPPVIPIESENMSRSVSVASRASDTRASIILDEMRGTEAAVEWTRDLDIDDELDHYNGILVLPDKSILEQYISRKRGKIDRYRGLRPSSMCSYASDSCASPCPSTVSELCLPSSVMVHEPRRRAQYSAEPLEHCTTPVPLNSTPRGFTTKKEPAPVIKPVPFEAPKTLFEKMIQDQANRNRTAAVSETRDPSPRRGSQEEGMSAISQQFAAAAAAGNGHGSVRYAAHIPVRSGEVSGRMSSGSVDSQQSSGTLDVASKNIDHVIDQARHRHHQHRSKFKEAIDYLDQIFEDLKKECDPDDKNNNDENNKPSIENQSVILQKPSAAFVAVKKKPTTTSVATSSSATSAGKTASASDSKRSGSTKQHSAVTAVKPTVARQKSSETGSNSSFSTVKATTNKSLPQAPSPVEVVIPVRKISQGASSNNQPEPTVAETIVLAKKTDKMDFTRRWLQDDLQSLAHLPPANIAPNASYYQDFDEHSLGSCSAEVAAFNTVKEKKNGKSASRKISDSSDMIRPRPFRPQPVYPMVDGFNGPSAFEPFSSHTLPRVASNDQIPSEMKRSGSQDPYNTLRSMRSEGDGIESSRPSPSAFQQVSPFNRGSSMRSSLRSLPDHSPVRQRVPLKNNYDVAKDPVLSIDQLVAELELNTENTFSSSDKRRSFPTSFGRPQTHQAQQHHVPADYEKPNRYRAEMRHVPTRGRAQNFATSEPAPKASVAVSKAPVYSQPIRQQQQQQQQQPKSLDEVTSMLNRAVSQFGSDQRQAHQHPSVYKQLSQQSFGSVHSNNAFETINQEKINPSRVEAMHNMFERGTAPTSWKMQQPKESYDDRNQKMSPLHEVTYATLNSYSPTPQNPTNGNGMARNTSQNHISYHDYTPQLPTTQPPQRPPGSANSSQGGYYSSNSSGIGSNYPQNQQNQYNNPRRSLIIDQQSISSRMPSVENDDDDGFYDNIGIYNDDRRYSRGSELENSASFRQLPPASNSSSGHKHNRIGSFLRKIGGVSSRPPGSAASLMSLNKISNETIIKPGGLMKSNSLSNEPWKKVVLGGASMPREANNNHKAGLGARLKNSLFGSRKRLDG
ncbi:hypothetical protein CRE_28378 [Caenorhabditis remanei]|uniref:Uncharacterized protein n=1 Tax=Caenorhabditis remanei TaxID=31234 RepID=E3LM13_CAERE|nr:hypothetical protein CRE_28378 [Caenorhabditis remanei]